MSYLEMFIEETQRMYPAAVRLDRVCNQEYEFEGIKLSKGQSYYNFRIFYFLYCKDSLLGHCPFRPRSVKRGMSQCSELLNL